jgi:hypothetical protein
LIACERVKSIGYVPGHAVKLPWSQPASLRENRNP